MELRQIESGKSVTVISEKPFTTNRLLIGQFTEAEEMLNKGMKQLQKGRWLLISPLVVIQPMEKTDGGLSQVEERVFQELAFINGARRSTVWVGHKLTDQEVLSKAKRGALKSGW